MGQSLLFRVMASTTLLVLSACGDTSTVTPVETSEGCVQGERCELKDAGAASDGAAAAPIGSPRSDGGATAEAADPKSGQGGTAGPPNTSFGGGGAGGEAIDAPVPEPSPPTEECVIPAMQWQPVSADLNAASLLSKAVWHEDRFVLLSNSAADGFGADWILGSFDPCTNTWTSETVPRETAVGVLLGWDGQGFLLSGYDRTDSVALTGFEFVAVAARRLEVDGSITESVAEPTVMVTDTAITAVYPEGTDLPDIPEKSSYLRAGSTAEQAFVWGEIERDSAAVGYLFDYAERQWRPVSTTNAPPSGRGHALTAAGDRFVVWGGTGAGTQTNEGGFYDPGTDTWQAIPTEGAPPAASASGLTPLARWVDGRLVVISQGQAGIYEEGVGWRLVEGTNRSRFDFVFAMDDARLLLIADDNVSLLDVADAAWHPIELGRPPVSNNPWFFHAAATGTTALLWGSSEEQPPCVAPPGAVCDLTHPYLPSPEGVMLRLE